MNIIIPIIVIGVFFITVISFIAKRSIRFKKCLILNGFEIHENYPEYIDNICEELFDKRVHLGVYYRGRIDSEWGDDAWVIDVDSDGDENSAPQVLITSRRPYNFPEFILGLSVGVAKINGLFKYFDRLERKFRSKKTDFYLLSEPYQPFLQKRKGIIVYAKEDIDVRKVVLPSVLNGLRSGGYGGAAFCKERIVVWTESESNPDKLFIIAKELQKGLCNPKN